MNNQGKISNPDQTGYVRRYTLSDGAEAGIKIAEVNNGKLRFILNESKALDMPQLWHKGVNISFLSKNGICARETSFSQRFEGGMIYTCGLDSLGGREGFELHGSFHNTPAKIVRCGRFGDELTVEAEIRNTELFGKNLVMRRKVTTSINSDTLKLSDTLANEGYADEKYCLLYHVNVGYPMLDEGVAVHTNAASVTPRTEWAKKNQALREKISEPEPDREETCYFIAPRVPEAKAVNEKLGKEFSLGWSGKSLPHFVQWISAACGDYALGLEPASTLLDDGFKYSVIKAGESVDFELTLKVTDL